MNPVIHWFRRDLRLDDNTALKAAFDSGAPVIPLFIFDPALLKGERLGVPRLKFMLKGLEVLDAELRHHNRRLLIRHGDPLDVLPKLIADTGAQAVYFNRDYSPYATKRDAALAKRLDVPLHGYDDLLLHPPGDVLKQDGDPYVVYTPFRKTWHELPKPASASYMVTAANLLPLDDVETPDIPTLEELGFDETIAVPEAGEKVALKRLHTFVDDPIYDYRQRREIMSINPFSDPGGQSGLGAYFRMGMLSARQAYQAASEARDHAPDQAARESVDTWIGELAWREFFTQILYFFPKVYHTSFREKYEKIPFRHAPDELRRWKDGRTGYPIVDAAMRQLQALGWIHNRARMITASFLTKDLLIYWREGDVHFMHWLIDGDPAANNGNWQWAAGTGTDAQPFFRIFNPVSQAQRYDPRGDYVRQWVPELRDVPDDCIHAPWTMDTPPKDYPAPMLEHAEARRRALDAFKSAKN